MPLNLLISRRDIFEDSCIARHQLYSMDDVNSRLTEAANARGLPVELLEIVFHGQGSEFLDAVAQASLDFDLTDDLLPYFFDVAADTSQRWIQSTNLNQLSSCVRLASCFGRILPFLPYLRPTLRDFLTRCRVFHQITPLQSIPTQLDESITTACLTALFRLLAHDTDAFREYVKPVDLCSLFSHEQLHVRYLAIQCFCKVMRFADALNQDLVVKHIGDCVILGTWEGHGIDYRLFLLHEEQRWKRLGSTLSACDTNYGGERLESDSVLTTGTVSIAGITVPRPRDSVAPSTSFVHFSTSTRNLKAAAGTLLGRRPTLVVGAAGSGKTAIIRELAVQTGTLPSLITLHLNDQTDAKSLLGIYTSSTSGAGFSWQPGVLTKAVAEGRWLLIEDIDRAPSEVIGLLRPLIENNSLSLSSRKETIKAGDGFRIFGTIRSTSGLASGGARNAFLSNPRLWCTVRLEPYSTEETKTLLTHRFPSISPLLAGVLSAHNHLAEIYATNIQFKASQGRLPSIKDLVKWCRRLSQRYKSNPASSRGLMPETFMIDAFKDGLDCYAAHLPERPLYDVLAYAIAEGLNIPPNVVKHTLEQQSPIVQEQKSQLQVGRSNLVRSASNRSKIQSSRFALTRQVRHNMEAIVSAISMKEPLLLVGETGVGKTTILQYIASRVGRELTVVNLSNQSEASDLLGGLKPITTKSLIIPLIDEFNDLFDRTFSANKNADFRESISKAFQKKRWSRLISHWEGAIQLASKSLSSIIKTSQANGQVDQQREQSVKRRKIDDPKYQLLQQQWSVFAANLSQVKMQVQKGDQNQIFAFVESRLVKAVRSGGWLLLDEINLASSETLDNIVSLLHLDDGDSPHLLLAEAGNVERIDAHPDFRVFAAMNPATDTGKKDLPIALRTLFTELYVMAGDTEVNDLVEVINSYLDTALNHDKKAAHDLAVAYLALKELNAQHRLTDGAGDLPHFSLRSLTRCLQYVQQHSPSRGLRRAMLDGLQMSFFTVLDAKSQELALPAIEKSLFGSSQAKKAMQSQKHRVPVDKSRFVLFDEHAVIKGPMETDVQPHYILTKSVRRNLIYLARAASMSRFPILLQGPTSAGKTSMVEYLAKYSGNKFVRINNHEHTDLQEYLGSYASGPDGKLEFREGVLVEALRKGHWIVLDELNLAPSDVLEALNRLLDDNRELLIPETQEIIRPHPNFLLFATQNPAGLYGGRKRFSRAFRNRFLEIHVDDIPEGELQQILSERTQIAPTFCRLIVEVYKKLSLQRSSSRLFESRNSFATLRDLFRWASRQVDDRTQLAIHGYMLLAERVREPAEKIIVKQTLEKTLEVRIDEDAVYNSLQLPQNIEIIQNITWTRAMRRLYTLISTAISNNEPVLLVGETGCGKTQVCQCIAAAFGRPLNIYNAHSNTETGDLIGSQRPVRHKSDLAEAIIEGMRDLGDQYKDQQTEANMDMSSLIAQFKTMDTSSFNQSAVEKVKKDIVAYQSLFVWSDGTLVRAMREGCHFLLDEISLADDSVLERMNSVLEPSRTILLAEKGAEDNLVTARPDFQFLATMNPGGDYGKRELSAALRNRLTEIWVPPLSDDDDVVPILRTKLSSHQPELATSMVSFAKFFQFEVQGSSSIALPLRLLLNWAEFIKQNSSLPLQTAIVHGAAMTFVDGLGANPASLSANVAQDIDRVKDMCLATLSTLFEIDARALYLAIPSMHIEESQLRFDQFALQRFPGYTTLPDLNFGALTTLRNASRVVRALQTGRPLLLEGNPGVGKTAIVATLAKLCGRPLTRVNLSDQTDLMDLFGADTPAEGEGLGNFVWRDGPLLKAMQSGGWVLLDEMNLASQSVLEGLNACLDHRKEVYVAELDKTFHCHPDFTLFATQNPHAQGGGRKGLPASFVNRFTVVYADPFTEQDLVSICTHKYPQLPLDQVTKMVSVIDQCQQLASQSHFFVEGGPWELNLRDLERWLSLCEAKPALGPASHFRSVISHRFRNPEAQRQVRAICEASFGSSNNNLYHHLTHDALQVGTSFIRRDLVKQSSPNNGSIPVPLLDSAKSFLIALDENWPIILSGRSGSGKTTLIRCVAALVGAKVEEFSMTGDVDTADLIGGYEQFTPDTALRDLQFEILVYVQNAIAQYNSFPVAVKELLEIYDTLQQQTLTATDLLALLNRISYDEQHSNVMPVQDFKSRVEAIQRLEATQSNQFVWTDGVLIDAMLSGSWMVLDHANLCNPSVLDRLNSLLEPSGNLILSEQHAADGQARIVVPASGFRIILTADSAFGELSRAMRNRSLEISLSGEDLHESQYNVPEFSDSSTIERLRALWDADGSDQVQPAVDRNHEPWLNQLTAKDLTILVDQPGTVVSGPNRREINLYAATTSLTSTCVRTNLPVDRDQDPVIAFENWPYLVPVNEPILPFILGSAGSSILDQSTRVQMLNILLRRSLQELDSIKTMDFGSKNDLSYLIKTSPNYLRSSRDKKLPIPAFGAVSDLGAFVSLLMQRFYESKTSLIGYELLRDVTLLLQDLIAMFSQSTIGPTDISSYLQVIMDTRAQVHKIHPELENAFVEATKKLGQASKLRTGQSLRLMWPKWKAPSAGSSEELTFQLNIESLVKKFDDLSMSLPQTRAYLAGLRVNLLEVYDGTVDTDNADRLVQSLYTAVEELSVQAESNLTATGHFADIFDKLLYKARIQGVNFNSSYYQTYILFGKKSTPTFAKTLGTRPETPVEILRSLTGDPPTAEEDRFSDDLLPGEIGVNEVVLRFQSSLNQPLGRLRYAQEEMQHIVNVISGMSSEICTPNAGSLIQHAQRLFLEFLKCHHDHSAVALMSAHNRMEDSSNILESLSLAETDGNLSHLQEDLRMIQQDLHRLNADDTKDRSVNLDCGRLLVRLCIVCLKSFVPDQRFDPDNFNRLLITRHEKRSSDLEDQLNQWRSFQKRLSGQNDNFITRILSEDLSQLGDAPDLPRVYRPRDNSAEHLHAEFMNLLRSVVNTDIVGEILQGDYTRAPLLYERIKVCIGRLSQVHRAYDDMLGPVTGLLQALKLGLKMATYISREHNSKPERLGQLRTLEMMVSEVHPEMAGLKDIASIWGYLKRLRVGLSMTINNPDVQDRYIVSIALLVDELYLQWKAKLDRDTELAEQQARYYSYRGEEDGSDPSESDVRGLFPIYEGEDDSTADLDKNLDNLQATYTQASRYKLDPRTSAIELSTYHRGLQSVSDTQTLLRLSLQDEILPRDAIHIGFDDDQPITAAVMPALILNMDEKLQELSGKTSERAINVYTDSELSETHKLFDITLAAQKRFREISEQWPDHTVPVDVLRFCDEVMSLKVSTPIAKLMTKTEKMLEVVAQWQIVASREWSVSGILDSLTNLIIRWRRLELASWSRLLDDEDEKVQEEVDSWYFIAYESVVYNPRRMVQEDALTGQSGRLREFCSNLASTLRDYLQNATLGQFCRRLELLEAMAATLAACVRTTKHIGREVITAGSVVELGALKAIIDTVKNVIVHYQRYEPQVIHSLSESRKSLEKKITEQIQLASWKDTNITALRESARRSHFKLFKIVKQYRSLLHQTLPTLAASIAKRQGTTKIEIPELPPLAAEDRLAEMLADDVRRCERQVPDWSKRPQRLRDTTIAASTIRYLHTSSLPQFTASDNLRIWLEDIKESAQELRKETPSVASKDSTALVRDLKQRKRRLLADTLKDLAAFGIRRNIGTDELTEQSSTALVLSSVPQSAIESPTHISKSADDSFHTLLDVLPPARSSAVDHSEDLTDGEVQRSLGFLEGGLSLAIRQRRGLGSAQAHYNQLADMVSILANVLVNRPTVISADQQLAAEAQRTSRLLDWLPSLLTMFSDVVAIQGQNASLESAPFIATLAQFQKEFEEYAEVDKSRRNALPLGLTTYSDLEHMKLFKSSLAQLNQDLTTWTKREPQFEHVCQALATWTKVSLTNTQLANGFADTELVKIDETVRDCLDAIFVAIQNTADILKSLPSSKDSPGWLSKTSQTYSKALNSMQCHAVRSRISDVVGIFKSVSAEDLQVALSLVMTSYPIIAQYQNILHSLLQRTLSLHLETCEALVYLSNTFTTLAKEGFCNPPETDNSEENTGKVEQGTGLGEGDAAQDISKDVGEDEDLTDLAQEAGERQDESNPMEKSKDAVDMGADDLEGEMGSGDEQASGDEADSDGEDQQDDMDEETGEVDDLDPAAVDEKLWDEKRDEAEQKDKEMKSQKAKGQKSDDQTAKNEEADAPEDDDVEADDNGMPDNEERDGGEKPEGQQIDQHLQEEDKLDLPEDMQLNGEEEKEEADGSEMGELSDMEEDVKAEDTVQTDLPDEEMVDREGSIEADEQADSDDEQESRTGEGEDEEMLDQLDGEEAKNEDHTTREDNLAVDTEDQEGGEAGMANNQANLEERDENAPQGQNSTETAAKESKAGQNTESNSQQENGESAGVLEQGAGQQTDSSDKQEIALQKLADVLERYHQRREIFTQNEERQQVQADQDVDMADVDFEHLGDTEDNNETQAVGNAEQETHHDSRQAIEDSRAEQADDLPMPQDADNEELEINDPETLAQKMSRLQHEHEILQDQGQDQIVTSNAQRLEQVRKDRGNDVLELNKDELEETREVHEQSVRTLANLSALTSGADAQQLWSLTSNKTQALSLTLTEQLRLILQPTTATKLRGDFRTGKRLNIRRIIPYIASGYKRDKIWMRRSIPSKRNYQVMLAVDDSKSMAESGADILALETLCMLSRSLSMLEVGELSVVAFGKNYLSTEDSRPPQAVRIAHPFSTPFSPSISGPEVFRNFTFNQTGTNIRALLQESISLFKDARLKSSAREAADLWQLQIIISDGHIGSDSDDGVRRLVRKAREEKIVSVFVVVDNGKESIVDLKEALLDQDGEVKMKRYLEGFPFAYYVVVREVHDLPGVLCRVLKGWFEGVVEQG